MSLEENKTIVRKMIEAINEQNLASLDEVMAPDFVMHMHAQQMQGWEVSRQVIEEEIKAFPDLHVTIEDIIAEGHKVCVRLKEEAHHTGEYRGVAPTGNKLSCMHACIRLWLSGASLRARLEKDGQSMTNWISSGNSVSSHTKDFLMNCRNCFAQHFSNSPVYRIGSMHALA